MIEVENLSKRLSGFCLNNISFKLPCGYIMGLIGENGAGKTTLLRILSGLYSYDSGNIQMKNLSRQDIGVVFQEEVFDDGISLIDNGERYGKYYINHDKDLLIEYMSRFSLDIRKKYKKCSKGEKLKFAFSFAMSNKPKLLILDEPSANFDIEFREEFHKILREFTHSEDRSVILSTHITEDIEKYADYILYLRKGESILYDDIETVRNKYRMIAGESYKIKLLKDRVIHMEENQYGCKALVKNSKKEYDKTFKVWEPSIKELMYYMSKGKI